MKTILYIGADIVVLCVKLPSEMTTIHMQSVCVPIAPRWIQLCPDAIGKQ